MNNAQKRIEILNNYELFDTEPEKDFDNITFLASTLTNCPISTITLIDEKRQWFKSKIGLQNNESPIESSFCALAISKSTEKTIIPKVMDDEDYKKIGSLNGLIDSGFYAGFPLKDKETGINLGTLCVIDYVNRDLSDEQIKSLEILADQTSRLFEVRKKLKNLAKNNSYLFEKYKELEEFTSVISHDLKSPLNNIISLTNIIKDGGQHTLSEENVDYINFIEESSLKLKSYVDGLLNFYKSDNIDTSNKENVVINSLIDEVIVLLHINEDIELIVSKKYNSIFINKFALLQILINILSNGIKYNNKEKIKINLTFNEDELNYLLEINDNGIGIKEENIEVIFDSFSTLNTKDRFGNYGTGIGLSTIKKILDKMKGKISVKSEMLEGTTFYLVIPK